MHRSYGAGRSRVKQARGRFNASWRTCPKGHLADVRRPPPPGDRPRRPGDRWPTLPWTSQGGASKVQRSMERPSAINALEQQVKARPLPRHVGIIMDGNGRWAEIRGLPRLEGHREGSASVREVARTARRVGLSALTLYAFSSQNW